MYSVIFVSSFIALAMNLIKIEPKISREKSRLLERQNLSSRLELWPSVALFDQAGGANFNACI